MSENHHHQDGYHHHHHRRDFASQFKERGLRAIARNRLIDKYLKIFLFILAVAMMILVVLAFLFG